MAAPDPSVIAQIAATYNVPPAILMAVGQHSTAFTPAAIAGRPPGDSSIGAFKTSSAMLQAYGVKPEDVAGDVDAQATVAARAMAALLNQYGSWENALSAYVAGDPNAYTSPTSDVGGCVYSVLGAAAADPSLGTQSYQPSDAQAFSAGALEFQSVLERFSSSGGMVTPKAIDGWQASALRPRKERPTRVRPAWRRGRPVGARPPATRSCWRPCRSILGSSAM